jgi:hypothetical protein
MLLITTLKIVDRHLEEAKIHQKTEPKKYTYMVESLKQIRESILIEYMVQNKSWLN